MKNICIVSSTRADFGLLCPLIKRINESKKLKLKLVITGSHLSKYFGNTVNEVEKENIKIDERIKLPLNFKDNIGMAKCTSTVISKFADYFSNNKIDMIVVLGDRYEIFGVCIAASMLNIPIAHIAGGEVTQGAVDEFIRHSITKMSYLHFTECEQYKNRVIQLGEDPKRVFNVGSLGVENIKNLKTVSMEKLSKELNIDLYNDYSLVTFHPVTKDKNGVAKEITNLIKALENYPNMCFIITKANADAGGLIINGILDKEANKHKNWRVVFSLGFEKYLSLMSKCKMVIGNSSSGIIETPTFKKPVINIGDRQKGRYMCKNIISCNAETKDIIKAIDKGLNKKFVDSIKVLDCPFGDGNTSSKIVKIIEKTIYSNIDLKKGFYDIKS